MRLRTIKELAREANVSSTALRLACETGAVPGMAKRGEVVFFDAEVAIPWIKKRHLPRRVDPRAAGKKSRDELHSIAIDKEALAVIRRIAAETGEALYTVASRLIMRPEAGDSSIADAVKAAVREAMAEGKAR